MAPWHNLSSDTFEEFCYHLLKYNGFTNLSWYGKGGSDKGRDIIATMAERRLKGLESLKKWVVQCKQYRKAGISKAQISDWLASCREHKPDRVLLIISRTLTANMKDWIQSVQTDYSFEVHIWEETELRNQYRSHGAKMRSIVPDLPKLPKPVRMYHLDQGEYFISCQGFGEVDIHVVNAGDARTAMEWAREFVEFIKANEFRFDGPP